MCEERLAARFRLQPCHNDAREVFDGCIGINVGRRLAIHAQHGKAMHRRPDGNRAIELAALAHHIPYLVLQLRPGSKHRLHEMGRCLDIVAAAEHQAIGGGIVSGEFQVGARHGAHAGGRRLLSTGRCFIQCRNKTVETSRRYFTEQCAKAAKVVLRRGMGDAGPAGNLAQRDFFQGHSSQRGFRSIKQALSQVSVMIGFFLSGRHATHAIRCSLSLQCQNHLDSVNILLQLCWLDPRKEIAMTAEQLFSIANPAALAGWLVLAWAVFRKNDWLRDEIAGRWWPLGFAVLYTLLILLFFAKAEGGFDTLANVQKLFTSPWAALAGWVHYLAFDLFVGALIARRIMEAGASRLWLVALLPATFLFGPIGLLASEAVLLATRPAANTI
jgi:hypothetical protein